MTPGFKPITKFSSLGLRAWREPITLEGSIFDGMLPSAYGTIIETFSIAYFSDNGKSLTAG